MNFIEKSVECLIFKVNSDVQTEFTDNILLPKVLIESNHGTPRKDRCRKSFEGIY